jgi:hypothetical protein
LVLESAFPGREEKLWFQFVQTFLHFIWMNKLSEKELPQFLMMRSIKWWDRAPGSDPPICQTTINREI